MYQAFIRYCEQIDQRQYTLGDVLLCWLFIASVAVGYEVHKRYPALRFRRSLAEAQKAWRTGAPDYPVRLMRCQESWYRLHKRQAVPTTDPKATKADWDMAQLLECENHQSNQRVM